MRLASKGTSYCNHKKKERERKKRSAIHSVQVVPPNCENLHPVKPARLRCEELLLLDGWKGRWLTIFGCDRASVSVCWLRRCRHEPPQLSLSLSLGLEGGSYRFGRRRRGHHHTRAPRTPASAWCDLHGPLNKWRPSVIG